MAERAKKELRHETISRRQLEIDQCLAEHGLMTKRRRRLHDVSLVYDDGRWQKLRAALVNLGPVFSSFGVYLSSRADLLPAKHYVEFSGIPDKARASPADTIKDLIDGELGCLPSKSFAAFAEEPFESRLIFQWHRARLFTGETVVVKVVHPELEEHLDGELELLSLLIKALPDLRLDSAIEDFRYTLKQQTDFVRVATTMAELYNDAPSSEARKVPQLHRECCTPRVLTFEHLFGSRLTDLIEEDPGSSDLANRLLLTWLQQSLLSGMFPVDPRPENILITQGQQIVFTGGGFASLPADVKANLYAYLGAVVNQDPDRACSYLLKEMTQVKGASEDELRHRIRQVVPFRDGGWTTNRDNLDLAEFLFVHWRLANECGYQSRPLALCFFRGLFQVVATARRLAPAGDPLLQGLQDLRMETVLAQFREMMTLGQLGDRFDKYAAIMADFPQRLNEALTVVAGGNSRLKYEQAESRPLKNSPATVIGLLLLLVAVVVLSHHLSMSASLEDWIDSAGAIIFLLVGALLIRVVCRV